MPLRWVFISSVFGDLPGQRKLAATAAKPVGPEPVLADCCVTRASPAPPGPSSGEEGVDLLTRLAESLLSVHSLEEMSLA